MRIRAGGKGWKTAPLRVPPAKQRRVTAHRRDGVAHLDRVQTGMDPTLGAAPLDEGRFRRRPGATGAALRGALTGATGGHRRRTGGGAARGSVGTRTQPHRAGSHRRSGTPLAPRRTRPRTVAPAGARASQQVAVTRQRTPGPGVHGGDGLGLSHFQGLRLLPGRTGQDLETDLQEQPQGPHGPGHEAGDVVAGDILHHLAAKAQDLRPPGEDTGAEDEVARRAGIGPCRAREAAGDGPPQRRPRPEPRGLEGQLLAVLGQRGLDGVQGGPCAGGDHQLLGLVVDDAEVAADVQRLAGGGPAEERLGAAAAQVQRGGGRGGGAHAFLQGLGLVLVHVARYLPWAARASRYFSASRAAMQPVPAEVIAWRYTWSITSPAAKTPATEVAVALPSVPLWTLM